MKDMYGQPLHILDNVEVYIDSKRYVGMIVSPTKIELESGELISLDSTQVAIIPNREDKNRYIIALFVTVWTLVLMLLLILTII